METVLLVEDDSLLRELSTRVLRAHGYTVLEASNGKRALELLETVDAIDIVVTDVVMPEMRGPVFVQHMRKSFPCTRVLYVSGYTGDAIARNGTWLDDMPFLPKPFKPSQLVAKVRSVLDTPAPRANKTGLSAEDPATAGSS